MAQALDSSGVLAKLQAGMCATEPSSELLSQLGGWPALEAVARDLMDDEWLTPVMSLLAREATTAAEVGGDLADVEPAAVALAQAVLASTDPFQFTQGLQTVCSTPILVELVGRQVADQCLTMAGPPTTADAREPTEAVVLRHAVALETLHRLALQNQASKYKVLGLLADIGEPQPLRYARAVTRSVTTAFDYWAPDDDVADVIDRLTGAATTRSGTKATADALAQYERFRVAIAPDATWAKANIEVARALRAPSAAGLIAHLGDAMTLLAQLAELDDRDDVKLFRGALALLLKLLESLAAGAPMPLAANDWNLALAEIEGLSSRADELTFGAHGLNHWSGDRKLVVLQGWTRLIQDLGWLRDKLERDSLYDASVVLDDILGIYSVSRAYDVVRTADGVERVMEVVRPAIASGFAAKAGLLRNLTDHIEHLQAQFAVVTNTEECIATADRLKTAETVLDAVRISLLGAGSEPPGKLDKPAAALPPLLAEIFSEYPDITEALQREPISNLKVLAANLADMQAAAWLNSDLVVTQLKSEVLRAIASCDDFSGDVVPAVTMLLDQLIKFVASRMNAQASHKAYLYDPRSNEKPLQQDLYDWLSMGPLANNARMEVQEVAGGRVDIEIHFAGFQVYLEVKADSTWVAVEEKEAYIRQTATYQATSVRIGFLVVLRTKGARDGSPPQHLTDYVTHTTMKIEGSASVRHVVMLEIPGGRRAPSAK